MDWSSTAAIAKAGVAGEGRIATWLSGGLVRLRLRLWMATWLPDGLDGFDCCCDIGHGWLLISLESMAGWIAAVETMVKYSTS